ncbi:hypothetical protein LTR95_008041 [Oleoguttula sp. CCFEE 5521]
MAMDSAHVVPAPGHLTEEEKDFDIESSPSRSKYDTEKYDGKTGMHDLENATTVEEGQTAGEKKFKALSWPKLTICLIVEAIALGSLSVPSAFAAVGMVAGVLLSVGLGLIAIYTSYVVGQVKLRHPGVAHYADAVKLI